MRNHEQMSEHPCAQCGHERYAHSPFHDGRCIADKPFDGDYVCDCTAFVTDAPETT